MIHVASSESVLSFCQTRTEWCDPEARLEMLLVSVTAPCYAPVIAAV